MYIPLLLPSDRSDFHNLSLKCACWSLLSVSCCHLRRLFTPNYGIVYSFFLCKKHVIFNHIL